MNDMHECTSKGPELEAGLLLLSSMLDPVGITAASLDPSPLSCMSSWVSVFSSVSFSDSSEKHFAQTNHAIGKQIENPTLSAELEELESPLDSSALSVTPACMNIYAYNMDECTISNQPGMGRPAISKISRMSASLGVCGLLGHA